MPATDSERSSLRSVPECRPRRILRSETCRHTRCSRSPPFSSMDLPTPETPGHRSLLRHHIANEHSHGTFEAFAAVVEFARIAANGIRSFDCRALVGEMECVMMIWKSEARDDERVLVPALHRSPRLRRLPPQGQPQFPDTPDIESSSRPHDHQRAEFSGSADRPRQSAWKYVF